MSTARHYWTPLFLGLALAPAAAVAQTVHWEQSPVKSTEFMLIFERCQPQGLPTLPPLAGAQAELVSQTTHSESVAGKPADYVKLLYRVHATDPLSTIPAFKVKTDKGILPVAGISFGPSSPTSTLLSTKTTVWAGEVFPVTYQLSLNRRTFSQLETYPDWTPKPLAVDDWSKAEPSEGTEHGEARLYVTYRTQAYATKPGPLPLESVAQIVWIKSAPAADPLAKPHFDRVSVESTYPTLTVRELPPAPAGVSTVAVGQFRLNSTVVPDTVAVGDVVTWTLELQGSGNWPEIDRLPQREASVDFQAVVARPKRTLRGKKLSDVSLSEDIALVATKAGRYALAPVSFTFFEPNSGTYKTVTTPATTITVTAPAGAASAVPSTATQKIGGLSDRKLRAQPGDAALAMPLQNLDLVRNQDSPSRLFQLMEGEKKAPTPTKTKDR